MTPAIKYLNGLGITTSNRIRAVRDAGELEYDANTYRRVIGELTGLEVDVQDDEAKYVFMYTVDNIMIGSTVDMAYANAVPKASKYVATHPWVLVKPDYSTASTSNKVDALGKPKQKKGAKKAAAIKFWNANKDETWSRKEWIEHLCENVGLTKGAASTYHYNLSRNKW